MGHYFSYLLPRQRGSSKAKSTLGFYHPHVSPCIDLTSTHTSDVGSVAALQLGAPAPGVTPFLLPDEFMLVRLLPWRLNLLKLVEPYCGGVRRTEAALKYHM